MLLKKPRHDTYYILLAEMSADVSPYWSLARPYQPSSLKFSPTLIGATNPIWVDADGDGKFTSARGYAEMLVARHGGARKELLDELVHFDHAVIWQCAELIGLHSGNAAEILREAPVELQQPLRDYVRVETQLRELNRAVQTIAAP